MAVNDNKKRKKEPKEKNGNEGVGLNHPDFDKMTDKWQFIRDSIDGEDAMKERAEGCDYILIPEAMRSAYGEQRSPWQYRADASEAHHYVERARYPDVVMRAIDMASGKALSRDPHITASEEVTDVLDEIWADGSDFSTGVLNVLREALSTRCGGLFTNLNDEGKATVCLYPAEDVSNWKNDKDTTSLVVIEDSEPEDDIFSHESSRARIVLGLDSIGYWMERYIENVEEGDSYWELEGQRTYPTNNRLRMKEIPFVPLGGWDTHKPPFNPLARAALAYFRASAEYNHIMWWTASPQPFINFNENGNFYGVDEFNAMSPNADGEAQNQEIELRYGSSTPILLRDGKFDFAAAPSGALSAHEKRLESLREEMSGLGARAFQNKSSGQQTAETERLQQAGEGAVVWLVLKEVAQAVTRSVRMALQWRRIPNAEEFEFAFNRDLSFEPFDLAPVSSLTQLNVDGYLRRADVRRFLRKVDAIEPGITDEELDKQILDEQEQFGSNENDFTGNPNLPLDDDLSDEEISSESRTDLQDEEIEEAA